MVSRGFHDRLIRKILAQVIGRFMPHPRFEPPESADGPERVD